MNVVHVGGARVDFSQLRCDVDGGLPKNLESRLVRQQLQRCFVVPVIAKVFGSQRAFQFSFWIMEW